MKRTRSGTRRKEKERVREKKSNGRAQWALLKLDSLEKDGQEDKRREVTNSEQHYWLDGWIFRSGGTTWSPWTNVQAQSEMHTAPNRPPSTSWRINALCLVITVLSRRRVVDPVRHFLRSHARTATPTEVILSEQLGRMFFGSKA